MNLKINLIRPDDLLNLQLEGVNMQIETADPANPVFVPIDQQQPAYLIVHFPPQTIAEEAFYEQASYQPKGVKPPDDRRLHETPPIIPVKSAGDVVVRMGGATRLVFRVPADVRLPFTSEGLLDWSKFELHVSPIADVAFGAEPPQEALTIRPPAALETDIELPYRLHLSPTHNVIWDHTSKVVSHQGRAELWHTRLASRKADGEVQRTDNAHMLPLRAIWSPDYKPDQPPLPGDFGPIGVLSVMSPYDRHSIVVLSSAFRGYARDEYTLYVPKPIDASLLMLSSLGGWLRSVGAWEPPYKILPRRIVPLPPWWDEIFKWRVVHSDVNGDEIEVNPNESEKLQRDINFDNISVSQLIPGIANQLYLPEKLYNLGQQLDLSQWVHIASQGRDHYVRIVYEGRLKWTGHRAALIKVTERRFEDDPETDSPVAYLRQYMYIVVREPEKDYQGLPNDGRGMPLKKIRITTLVTPKIDYPYSAPSKITNGGSFWIRVADDYFRFHAIAEDLAGNKVDFTTPLIFVPNSDTDYQTINNEYSRYSTPDEKQRRTVFVPGQRVAFADAINAKDNTSFVTQTLNFINEGISSKEAFFQPKLFKADVRIPAVEQLVGTNTMTSIQLLEQYVKNGFADASNTTGVFAKLVQENASGGLDKFSVGVEFAANQAGGFATPNFDITNLSRQLGPLGGEIDQSLKDAFDPEQVFKKGLAKIFGAFDLADLIPKDGSASKNAPKMQIRREGTTAIAELDWRPDVHEIDLIVIKFTPYLDTKFDVHGVFKKNLGAPLNDDFTLEGLLNHFELFFLNVVQINFALFSFKAQSGKKTDVNVKLDATQPVQFIGDLEFVEGLRQLIPPGVFGDGVSIDLIQQPLGVKAGLSIGLPPAAVGVFALQNILFDASLTVPFVEGKPIFDFAFARRDNPFLLTVSFLGGGGFFRLELDTDGIRVLEAAFEFGATAALNLGVASGEVHIMAGIYFKMEKRQIKPPGNPETLVSILSGYMRCGGSLSVLGLISVSVEFVLSFTYDSNTKKASGRATLTVTIEIAFFSKSVELTVERSFGRNGSDPTFAQLMDSPCVWSEYAGAFA